MDKTAVSDLSSAIHANSRRLTLDELKAQGKRHVRVVSAQRVMRIIEAIVDDAIGRETSRKVRTDRDKIISETRQQFDRVMKLQAEQEAAVREHREEAEAARRDHAAASERLKNVSAEFEAEREDWVLREARLMADHQERIAVKSREFEERMQKLEEERSELERGIRKESHGAEQARSRLAELEDEVPALKRRAEALAVELKSERDEQALREARLLGEIQDRTSAVEAEKRRLYDEVEKLRGESERVQDRADKLEAEREETSRKLRALEQRLARAKANIESGREKVDLLTERLEAERDDRASRELEIKKDNEDRIRKLLDEQKGLIGRLESESGEAVARQEKVIAEAQARIRDLEDHLADARRSAELANTRSEQAERSLADLREGLTTAGKSLDAHQDAIDLVNARIEKERDDAARREKEIVERYDSRIREISEERDDMIARIESERGEFSVRQERAIREAQARAADLEDRLGAADRTVEAQRSELEDLRRKEQALRGQIEGLASAEDALRKKLVKENALLEQERGDLIRRFESERGELAGRQEQALSEARRRIDEIVAERDESRQRAEEATQEVRKQERTLRRIQTRQTRARETVKTHQEEIERLVTKLDETNSLLESARAEVEAVRSEAEASSTNELREGLEELKFIVGSLNGKNSGIDAEALDGLLLRLGEREVHLEDRVGDRMEQTLNEITRTLRYATASPIEVSAEATDVLVGRIFDSESEMKTNLASLSVEEMRGGDGITGNLERLKAARLLGRSEKS